MERVRIMEARAHHGGACATWFFRVPYGSIKRRLQEAFERTHRWELRSLLRHLEGVNDQAMFCVVHGGLDPFLRKESIAYLTALPFDGVCIGGSLGKSREDLAGLLKTISEDIPKDLPCHLLGIADVPSIEACPFSDIHFFGSNACP
jgi:queuine tRNA-ribosyltransferase